MRIHPADKLQTDMKDPSSVTTTAINFPEVEQWQKHSRTQSDYSELEHQALKHEKQFQPPWDRAQKRITIQSQGRWDPKLTETCESFHDK